MANLYLLTQNENNEYDTFDSCVVCAEDFVTAQRISPSGRFDNRTWASSPDNVTAVKIGTAHEDIEIGSVVISSFNSAG